jgi:hypothetical protein
LIRNHSRIIAERVDQDLDLWWYIF